MNIGYQWRSIPPVTKNLIIINVAIWLVEVLIPNFGNVLVERLGLRFWGSGAFNPVQLFTYMFLHDDHTVLHILFNMFTLWMFGRVLEQVWGPKRYLLFYLVCGVGAAVTQEVVWQLTWMHEYISGIAPLNGLTYDHMARIVKNAVATGDPQFAAAIEGMKTSMVTVGASGAIFGLLLGFAMIFPNLPMYIFFIPVPIKAKYMVIGYAVIELFLGVSGGGTIAHFAHLGGMLFGFILLLVWKKKGTLNGNKFFY
ncbi:MAG: rhomboid family intramembrane serine protease [Muribaculaceae bacterium]|nr:rhomboid family intramembrane serine protease [Muribaculaceae bacterium]